MKVNENLYESLQLVKNSEIKLQKSTSVILCVLIDSHSARKLHITRKLREVNPGITHRLDLS
jgi:hypothetical protein